jgi:hypothetical protein
MQIYRLRLLLPQRAQDFIHMFPSRGPNTFSGNPGQATGRALSERR